MFICILTTVSYTTTSFSQSGNTVDIFPPDSKPYGKSYEEHIIDDWKRILSIPADVNPMEDKTGERCTYGQELTNSSLFHLSGIGGGAAEIVCKIPAGLGLFINIISVEASEAESPGSTIEDLHAIAKNDQDHVTTTYLKIDDNEFKDLKNYRFHTDVFDVIFPENAVFGAAPGPSKAVADGYYVITSPLSPGNYTIVTKGSLVCLEPDCLEPAYATEVKYNVIVE
jgi:hypothetical protein